MLDTKVIIDDIKHAIENGFTKIIFDNVSEAVYFDIIRKIHRIIRILDNPNVEYYYVCSAQNGTEAYYQYCTERNIDPVLKIKSISFFENTQKGYLNLFYQETNSTPIEYKTKIKSKLFCCFNKQLREHRIRVFYNILTSGLLEKSYTSFYYGKEVVDQFRLASRNDIADIYEKHAHLFPLTLNVPSDRHNPIDVRADDLLYHSESYFSLVTETLFFKDKFDAGDSIFLTEKTFRPIIHKHPFILLAPAGSLSYLKNLGYKTFSPYIDESYDEIEDDEQRFLAVWNEVQRLCKFSNRQWITWQRSIADVVNHNYDMIVNKNHYVLN